MKVSTAIFLIATCLLVFLISSIGWADVPTTIGYQGTLADSAGYPLDGSQLIIFSIYDDPAAGTQIWSEQQTVDVQNGVFDVKLGAVVPLAVADFATDQLYLAMQIFASGTGWEALAPRQPLTSTAFAMHAGDADTLEGLGASDFASADHEHDAVYVNAGEVDAITSAMVAANTLTAADLAANAVGASELANNAVDTTAIASGAVTSDKISASAVGSPQIADGSISWVDLEKGTALVEISDDDGSGSGLDADLLDNHDSSYFATTSHLHDSRYVNTTGDTMTGPLTVEGVLSVGTQAGDDNDYLYMDSGTAEWLRWDNAQTRFQLSDALNIAVGSLAIGNHATQPAYNSIGSGTPGSSSISNSYDLYIQESIEVGINAYVDGALYVGTDNPDDDDTIYMDSSINEYLRWDESENDFLLSDDLRVTGEYTYNSPRTYYLNIPPAAFVPTGTSDETWVTDVDRAYISGGGGSSPFSVQVVAPVMLPQGATVTGLRLYYYDESWLSLSISGYLSRSRVTSTRSVVQLATIGSTTSTGEDNTIDYVEDTSISYATVENQDYQYAVYASFIVPGSTIGSALSFCGARVTYTVDRVGN